MNNKYKYLDNFKLIVILKCLLNEEVEIYPLCRYMTDSFKSNIDIFEELITTYCLSYKKMHLIEDYYLFRELFPIYYGNTNEEELEKEAVKPFFELAKNINEMIEPTYMNILGENGEEWVKTSVDKLSDFPKFHHNAEEYVNYCMGLTFHLEDKSKIKLETILNQYIKNYENNNLYGEQIYNYQRHLNDFIIFLELIENEFNLNHIEFDASCKTGDFCYYKFIEFLLLLQKKKYLKIKSIDFINTQESSYAIEAEEPSNKYDSWKCILEIYKTSKEIKELEYLQPNQFHTVGQFDNIEINTNKNEKHYVNKFTQEEIQILKLRKDGKKYKEIAKLMTPPLTEANVKRIATNINNKLGSNNIDEAVRLFEENYLKL